jgi:N-acetylmuramoyl-L-alanine amidase
MLYTRLKLSIVLIFLLGFIPSSSQANTLELVFEDGRSRSTLYTLVEGGVEYIPLNQVVQAFNLSRNWDSLNGMIILSYRGRTASITPDQPIAIVERRSYSFKNSPKYIEGILMIPLDYVINILPLLYDKEMSWDPSRRILRIGSSRVEIASIQHAVYTDYTRIIIQTNKSIAYKVVEKLPALLIIDLPEAGFMLPNNPIQVGSNVVKTVKVINSYGTTQVLINLGGQFASYNHFALNDPPRIVVDVYSTPGGGNMAGKEEKPSLPESELLNPLDILPKPRTLTSVRTVILDPGHGGRDNGITLGPNLWEKDITLNIAQKLSESIRRRLGVRVILTRNANDNLSPVERTTLANSTKADLFISLHVNNSFSPNTRGFEVYTLDAPASSNNENPETLLVKASALDHAQEAYLDKSERLANYIVTAYNEETKSKDAKRKKAPLLVLKGATMPAIQIEMGYFSNPVDKEKITQEDFQKLVVKVITDGIVNFKRYLEQVSLN